MRRLAKIVWIACEVAAVAAIFAAWLAADPATAGKVLIFLLLAGVVIAAVAVHVIAPIHARIDELHRKIDALAKRK